MGGNPELKVKWPKKNGEGSVTESTSDNQDWKDIYQQVANERQSHIKTENERIKDRMEAQAKQVQVTNRITVK